MGEFSSARSEGTRVGPVVLGPAIGQGGEGIIYLGEHDVLGQVAVKEFYPSLMASRDESKLARAANPSWQKQFRDGVDKFVGKFRGEDKKAGHIAKNAHPFGYCRL